MRAYFLQTLYPPFGARSLPSSRRTFLQQASALSLLYSAQRTLSQTSLSGMKTAGAQTPAQTAAIQAAPSPNPPHIGPPMLRTLQLPPFVDALPLTETIRPSSQNRQPSPP